MRRDASEATLAKDRQVLELRRAGVTFDVIAARLGFRDRSGAYRAYSRAMLRTLQPVAAEIRTLEVDRLDRLHAAYWPAALQGDVQAAVTVLRIMDRRAKLLGLDAPARSEVRVSDAVDTQIEELARQLGMRDGNAAS